MIASVVSEYLPAVLLGYTLVFGGMALFAARLLARGRKLSRRLPDEAKPWI